MGDPLSDCSPLINAAASVKLRLVRLLVEGGAQVNGRNLRGETALLAACKALRGDPAGPDTVKLLTYLLQNKADPNAQDRAGRTALMYACMEWAGPQVASTLLSAGADPCMEDYCGASALVYAINAQHQPTIKVLMDALCARGHDIIIIATEMGMNGGPVTRRYLNVPPSPDTSPVSCMSPSDIVLKTGSPNSPEGENIFNFRGTSHRGSNSSSRYASSSISPLSQCGNPPPRQRLLSEPWLTCLNTAYKEGMRETSLQEEGNKEELSREGGRKENKEREDENENSHAYQSKMNERREELVQKRDNRYEQWFYNTCRDNFLPRISQSVLSLTEVRSPQATSSRLVLKSCETSSVLTSDKTTQKSIIDKLPACPPPHSHPRRNTLPSVMVVPPLLHLPPLVNQSGSHLQVPTKVLSSKSRSMVFLPHPPNSSSSSSSSSRTSARPGLLPSLPPASSVTSLVGPPDTCCSERSRKSARRHSGEDKWFRGEEQLNHLELCWPFGSNR